MMKNRERLSTKTILGAIVTLLVLFGNQTMLGQQTKNDKTDEQVLREIVQKENEGTRRKLTEDTILYNATVPRPVIGREAVTAKAQEVSASHENEKREKQVRRLVVAKSGDLAYEFGDTVISFDTPDKAAHQFYQFIPQSLAQRRRRMDGRSSFRPSERQ